MKLITTILLAATLSAQAADTRLLAAIREVESLGGRQRTGDKGRARGDFHMHHDAWADVTRCRQKLKAPVWSYDSVFDPTVGWIYANDYLDLLQGQFARATGRQPTIQESYALYNMGYAGFKRRQFNLAKAPARTREQAQRIENLVNERKQP